MIGLSNGPFRAWLLVGLSEPSGENKLLARELSGNQSILRFDVIMQHDWPIVQRFSILGFSLGEKRRVHALIFSSIKFLKQITNTYQTIFQGRMKITLTVTCSFK